MPTARAKSDKPTETPRTEQPEERHDWEERVKEGDALLTYFKLRKVAGAEPVSSKKKS